MVWHWHWHGVRDYEQYCVAKSEEYKIAAPSQGNPLKSIFTPFRHQARLNSILLMLFICICNAIQTSPIRTNEISVSQNSKKTHLDWTANGNKRIGISIWMHAQPLPTIFFIQKSHRMGAASTAKSTKRTNKYTQSLVRSLSRRAHTRSFVAKDKRSK